ADKQETILNSGFGSRAFAASRDQQRFAIFYYAWVYLYSRGSKDPLWQTKNEFHEVANLVFSPDKAFIAAEARDWRILLDASNGSLAGQLPGSGPISFGPDSRTIATGEKDGSILIWKILRP
ncbi:MAG: hypothetical protein Q8M76_08865, partial [Spirochaetaceae bacterium]|nr:hypothetical protein [Spirochaetaceae bacterium]